MKDKIISKIIIIALIIIMFIPIGVQIKNNQPFRKIKPDYIETILKNTTNYRVALIYADKKNENSSNNIKDLKKVVKNLEKNNINFKTYFVDTQKSDEDDLKNYNIKKEGAYTFIFNGEIIKTVDSNADLKTIYNYIGLYTNTGVDKEFMSYKVAADSKEFATLIKRKNDITVAIFGRNNCYFCNQYLPVYNTIAEEYGIDIYYFDSMSYDKEEYSKVLNSGLVIPASCTSSRVETPLNELASTPLTLFIKNNKVIDCIAGYTQKSSLKTKLQTLGMIEIEK